MKIDKYSYKSIKENKDTVELIRCRNNCLTVAIKKDNVKRLIHSKYDPVKEAASQVADFVSEIGDKRVFIVFGVGMGYHLSEIIMHLPKDGSAYIFEPNTYVLKLFFENGGSLYFNDKRITFYAADEYSATKIADEIVNMDNCESIAFYAHSVYSSLYSAEKDALVASFSKCVDEHLVQKNSIRAFGKIWCHNFLNNYKYIKQSSPVKNLFGIFNEKTAIIVSAGPSLTKNVNDLKGAKDKAVIICVDTAYKALKYAGILPDLLISISGGANAGYKLLDVEYSVPLVFKGQTNNDIVKFHNGMKFYAGYGNDFLEDILFGLGAQPGGLASGGSVACCAVDLAAKMGVSKIIFVGQDLACTDEKIYADNISVPTTMDSVKQFIIEVTDIHGGKIKTLKNLNQYKLWFEDYIRTNNHIKFIDATEGGALIEGTEIKDLKWALNEIDNDASCALNTIKQSFSLLITDERNSIIIHQYKQAYKNYLSAVNAVNELIALYTRNTNVSRAMVMQTVNKVNEHCTAIRNGILPYMFSIKNICIGKNPELELQVFDELASALAGFLVPFQSVLEDNKYD